MKKIMLVCSAGMSTSMLVTKMKKAAESRGLEAEIFAVAEAEVKNHTDVQVALLGPQVRFLKAKLEGMLADQGTPVDIIDTVAYGTMNGEKVLDQALSLIKA